MQRLARPSAALAVVRVTAMPLFLLADRAVDHPVAHSAPFPYLLGAATVYALAAAVVELRGRSLAPPIVQAIVDVALVSALVATSGGPFSQLRYAFFLLPVGAALVLQPRLTALASAVAVASYTLIALSYPNPSGLRPDAVGFEFTQALFILWMGVAATLLSGVLTARARAVAALAAQRRQLVAQALAAEEEARRRLAEGLHEDALQNLLAARQLLAMGDVELAREGLDACVTQIREAVFDLHPYLLEHGGLRAALGAIAEHLERRSGPAVRVSVEPAAEGVHDQLLFSIARELINNAVKHANASRIDVGLRRTPAALELEVRDDGRGIDEDQMRVAPRHGHIGLASCRERAEAIGGTFHVRSGPGGAGTRVAVSLPAPVLAPTA